jgi:hypothetical protein
MSCNRKARLITMTVTALKKVAAGLVLQFSSQSLVSDGSHGQAFTIQILQFEFN